MKIIDNFKDFFKDNHIDLGNKKLSIAVSTGIDSSVLLDMFLKLQKEVNFTLIVCHVNHHKRKQSEEEENYIKKYTEEKGIKLYIKDLFFDNNQNFQEEARNRRYEFFDEVMEKEQADYLVLAHHADDNIETILMRILRGSSLTGYAGIKEISQRKNYLVLRPLLRSSREMISLYQKENDIKYYEDESNSKTDYLRNKLRIEVIPKLKEIMPNLDDKMNEFSEKVLMGSTIVNEKRDEFIHTFVKNDNNNIVINKQKFLELNDFLKEEVLFEVLKKYKLSKANIEELNKIIESKKPNIKIDFKNLFVFETTYDQIIINNQKTDKSKEVYLYIDEIGEYVINDEMKIIVRKKRENEIPNTKSLCYNIITLPVVVRSKKPGDRILLGVGSKKVSDILIDEKILKSKRDEVLLLEKDDQILSILGIKKSIVLTKLNKCDIIIELVNKTY